MNRSQKDRIWRLTFAFKFFKIADNRKSGSWKSFPIERDVTEETISLELPILTVNFWDVTAKLNLLFKFLKSCHQREHLVIKITGKYLQKWQKKYYFLTVGIWLKMRCYVKSDNYIYSSLEILPVITDKFECI